jgi:hypothetical protein
MAISAIGWLIIVGFGGGVEDYSPTEPRQSWRGYANELADTYEIWLS